MMNNADYGMSLQKLICDEYNLQINDWAKSQFDSNYNKEYENEIKQLVPIIFEKIKLRPVQLLTFSREQKKDKQIISPHNFLLENGMTLSIRTTKSSDKVAPRTVGQAGFTVLNEFFSEIYGKKIESQFDVRQLVFEKINEIMPIFIDNLFQSDITVFLSRNDLKNIQIIYADEIANYTFSREEFTFTRGLDKWTESTTLKFHKKSIAEIQTHKERTFKFRFIVSAIPEWIQKIKENNESLGISAEGAICKYFNIKQPDSFKNRVHSSYVQKLIPVVKEAFEVLPPAIVHTGSTKGERGEQSKCAFDFLLYGNKTMSLKTNKGKMVCPPEVGQPGSKTCLLYFKDFFPVGTENVTREEFKKMVIKNIDKLIPIYVEHLFDSDWLLWIYYEKDSFYHLEISKEKIKNFIWVKEKFTFTKPNIEEWKESNTVKYDGKTIGEFQVHNNRNCFKFRFHMKNLLEMII